ncbi:serine/threonine-protein phosphatase [Leucobacter sp. cx-42]|uniref:PP2C family protein-serine/threonine phosphatase n=1 Tax=unclassified Leucobacter TaxID=2621730 RepID=UPI00165E738D|nr:serine/threonine-protein phosphatase [Leucobacter sp. cx-42]
MSYGYKSAIGSHVGMVRSNNQDSGFAGDYLYLVADGMGGHAGGDVASALVAKEIANQDLRPESSSEMAGLTLRNALLDANKKLRGTVKEHPELAGLGTTFCGFLTVGKQLALAHIGDSRLYRLRDDKLEQITKDHTFVQRLVDSGRITEEEAKFHPRRSVLMRVLGDVESAPEIDVSVLDTQPGDVWLLCSDGLCGYVEDPDIEKILRRSHTLQGAVDALIDKSLAHGAPDNVTVVLVETVEEEIPHEEPNPRFVGSAANAPVLRDGEITTARMRLLSRRRVRRVPVVEESHFEPRVDEYLSELLAETKRRNTRRRVMWLLGVVAVLVAIGGALLFSYQWTQSRYFVGTDGESVIIYQGVQQTLGSFSLYSVAEETGIPLDALDGMERRQIQRSLSAGSLSEARDIVLRLGGDE